MLSIKKSYNCHFDFKINTMDDIAVAMVLPSGLILSVYYIKCAKRAQSPDETMDSQLIAKKVVMSNAEENMEQFSVLEGTILDNKKKEAFEEASSLNLVKNYTMSNEKILLWNKTQILGGDLEADEAAVKVDILKLKVPS